MKFILLILLPLLLQAALDVDVKARSAILMNAESGVVLYEKDARSKAFPASTTKVATALFLLEEKQIDFNAMALVSKEALRHKPNSAPEPPHWLTQDSSIMGLVAGERITVGDLFHGLMMISGNDAANVLAETVSGSISGCVDALNAYFQKLGCIDTHFCNPHGYHHPDHYTTAYDLCYLTRRALQIPQFRHIIAKETYQKPKTNKQSAAEIKTTNALIRPGSKNFYPKAIGGKTGFHSAAQNALVAVAEDHGRTLIAVVFGCPTSNDRYKDSRLLFEKAFAEQKVQRVLAPAGQSYLTEIEGAQTKLEALLTDPLAISYYPSEEPTIKASIVWEVGSLPICKGQKVAFLRVVDDKGTVLAKQELVAKEDVSPTLLFRIQRWWNSLRR